jgi:lambda family phage portal protein
LTKKKGLFRRIADAVSGKNAERRFEAGGHDRDSAEHFGQVGYDRTLNEDLADDLPTMRSRCRDQAQNNALVRGAISTHKIDVVGSEGPRLDVQSDDERYDQEAEDFWRDWCSYCDYNGRLSFTDFLYQDIELAWTCGDSISQRLFDPSASTASKFRLLEVAPDRLKTPYGEFGDPDVVLGIRLSKTGRPIRYYVEEPTHIGPYRYVTGEFSELSGKDVIHVLEVLEPGQVRGIPWLASSLRAIANAKAFARETLEAARTATLFAAVATVKDSADEAVDFVPTNSPMKIPNRSVAFMPRGYDRPMQMAAQHPNTRYIDFMHEQYREIGRPVGMPLLTILLDARYHNYSSARYDGQVYRRTLNSIQSRLARQRCNPCAMQVLLDAERAGLIRRRPQRMHLVWGWTQPPEIDEHKAAMAQRIELMMGSTSLSQVCASRNRHFEDVVMQRMRDDEFLQANGLPTLREMLADSQGGQASINAEGGGESSAGESANRFEVGFEV